MSASLDIAGAVGQLFWMCSLILCLNREVVYCVRPWILCVDTYAVFCCVPIYCAFTGTPFGGSSLDIERAQGRHFWVLPWKMRLDKGALLGSFLHIVRAQGRRFLGASLDIALV
jgi:hypothetical protein